MTGLTLALARSIPEDGILYSMVPVDWAIHLKIALEQDEKTSISTFFNSTGFCHVHNFK